MEIFLMNDEIISLFKDKIIVRCDCLHQFNFIIGVNHEKSGNWC